MDISLVDEISELHQRVRESTRGENLYLGLYGFGRSDKKVVAMRALRYALAPMLVHGSTVSEGRWEALIVLDKWRPALADLEIFLLKFRMSIGVVDLETYMGSGMLACYERIEKGSMVFGSMLLHRNQVWHTTLQACLRRKNEHEHTLRMEADVGLPFTVQNMWALHHSLQNAELDRARLQNARTALVDSLTTIRRHVVDVMVVGRVMSAIVHNADFVIPPGEYQSNPRHLLQAHLVENDQALENLNDSIMQMVGQNSSPRIVWRGAAVRVCCPGGRPC